MSDLIRRADAIEAVIEYWDGYAKPLDSWDVMNQTRAVLETIPSAEGGDAEITVIPEGTGLMKPCPDNGADIILRADAIEAVHNWYDQPYKDRKDCIRGVDKIALDIEALPSAEAVQGWIPCSERLPEIDQTLRPCDQISEEVLGTDTYGNIRHVYLTKCGYLKPTFCTVEEGMSVDIVAWMPLPKPYKGGAE